MLVMYELAPSPQRSVLKFIDEVAPAHFRLVALAERMHADLGVAGPHRTVLKALFLDGQQSAPDLARRKSVTRQAVQPIVDDLLAKGLVSAADNPRHRRSPLYALTREGIDVCVAIQKREIAEIERLAPDADPALFEAALKAIRALNDAMAGRLEAADAA